MFSQDKPEYDVSVDACLTGVGAIWNDNVYAASRHIQVTWHLSITQLEMLNILIALRVFGDAWPQKSACIHIDNKAAMYSLKKGCIKDSFMQAVGRSVWLMAHITLKFVHIAGSVNQNTDLLSIIFEFVDKWQCIEKMFSNFNWWEVKSEMFYPNMLM